MGSAVELWCGCDVVLKWWCFSPENIGCGGGSIDVEVSEEGGYGGLVEEKVVWEEGSLWRR